MSVRSWVAALVLLWSVQPVYAAKIGGGGGGGGATSINSGTTLPVTCTPGSLSANGFFLDTDDEILYFCQSDNVLVPFLLSEAQTIQDVFALGKVITGANSLANAFRVGDGTTPFCIYTDSTLGPVIKPCTDSNTRTHIWDNFTWGIRDNEGDADMFIVDPKAATKKAMWAFQSGYYPLKSGWIPAALIEVDGTNCAAPVAATPVASGTKLKTILCADNDSSRMHITFLIPDDYDGGTITLTSAVIQTAADTGVIEFQARAQCKGDTETLVAITSFGTEVVWTDTMTGSGAMNKATSGAITPSGTCAAGDLISFSIDIGATNTTTAMATAHILGFRPTYSSTSLSH